MAAHQATEPPHHDHEAHEDHPHQDDAHQDDEEDLDLIDGVDDEHHLPGDQYVRRHAHHHRVVDDHDNDSHDHEHHDDDDRDDLDNGPGRRHAGHHHDHVHDHHDAADPTHDAVRWGRHDHDDVDHDHDHGDVHHVTVGRHPGRDYNHDLPHLRQYDHDHVRRRDNDDHDVEATRFSADVASAPGRSGSGDAAIHGVTGQRGTDASSGMGLRSVPRLVGERSSRFG